MDGCLCCLLFLLGLVLGHGQCQLHITCHGFHTWNWSISMVKMTRYDTMLYSLHHMFSYLNRFSILSILYIFLNDLNHFRLMHLKFIFDCELCWLLQHCVTLQRLNLKCCSLFLLCFVIEGVVILIYEQLTKVHWCPSVIGGTLTDAFALLLVIHLNNWIVKNTSSSI